MTHIDSCYARLAGDELVIGNNLIERRWNVRDGLPRATALIDRMTGRDWLAGSLPGDGPSITPPGPLPGGVSCRGLATAMGRDPVRAENLVATLVLDSAAGEIRCEFTVFPDVPAILVQLVHWPESRPAAGRATTAETGSGIEDDGFGGGPAEAGDRLEHWRLASHHVHLDQVVLTDHTDRHDNLVQVREFRLYDPEELRLEGSLFTLTDPLSAAGLVLVKLAPLPHARPLTGPADITTWTGGPARGGHGITAAGHGALVGPGYAWAVACFHDGTDGRGAVLHGLQRALRQPRPDRDGRFISNTWGDRNRDGRICDSFMQGEIAVAARLGLDAVQLDDGWQQGTTANSVARAQGGVWEGFWAADPGFWRPHPTRFPRGLRPTAAAARAAGLGIGLWFAPDSADDFTNWERDAETILDFWRDLDVTVVKADSVKARTKRGEANLSRLFSRVLSASGGAIAIDLDVTSGIRPGYLGAVGVGPLFIENRYTDLRRYWPHATLRNLWQLAAWIDPVRLRVELLNPHRHAELYADDPLAPARYPITWLFASVMVASPLAWCELGGLPEADVADLAGLVAIWRQHRAALHGGLIRPAGGCPDGIEISGFVSHGPQGIYLIALRSIGPAEDRWPLPGLPAGAVVEHLAGTGHVAAHPGEAAVDLPNPYSFVFARITAPG